MMAKISTAPLPTEVPALVASHPAGARRLWLRANSVLLLVWLLGAMPSILRLGFAIPVPAAVETVGWGLWLPGAGFIAAGGWWLLMFPVTLAVFEVARFLWTITGNLAAPLLVWLGAAFWAAGVSAEVVLPQAVWLVPLVAIGYASWQFLKERREQARERVRGVEFAAELPALLAEIEESARTARDPRELDPTQLAAARYVFGLALQPVGQLAGFNHIDNFQSASLRYQLNNISYTLAAVQCRYLPKFHGYLNQAQRFAIESLALPNVCGYWKWEYLWGRFGWNPDPVGTLDNVMLTGWSQVALTTYAATTGDLRYQAEDALPFRPSARSSRIYGHDAHSFTRSIVANWKRAPTTLYACEPHWVFPLCNAYAYCGVVPYDRVNGTAYASEYHNALTRQLEADYLLADGSVRPVLNTLTGWHWLSRGVPAQVSLSFLLQLCRVANGFHPGYARRWYAYLRKYHVSLQADGRLKLHEVEWDSLMDAGNYKKGPGYLLGLLVQTAREFGDEVVANAALDEVERHLKRVGDQGVLAYEGTSTLANIGLAGARLAGFADWQTMIARGPRAEALAGPVLAECAYPEVLVAAAHGDCNSLHLVLYPGVSSGQQQLKIDRLEPGCRYRVTGAMSSTLDAPSGKSTAMLLVQLDGRTEVRLQRER